MTITDTPKPFLGIKTEGEQFSNFILSNRFKPLLCFSA